MTTTYHTPLETVTPVAANGATFNSVFSELDEAIGDLTAQAITWGANVTNNQLKAWAEAGSYELTAITYHGTYTNTVSTATVKWPDTSAGTFTATTIDSTWQAINAYTITHTASSKTVTQSAVTRNSAGNITTKPALTVA